MLNFILNLWNFFFGGFVVSLGWLITTFLSAILIVILPYTRSCWEIFKLSLVPFGHDIIHVNELEPQHSVMNGLGAVLNIVWFVLFGWWLALAHIIVGVMQCLTIIGIPNGIMYFKLVRISLFPVGQRVVEKDYATYLKQRKIFK
ncbi:YccF domain-containing protein [Gallibacterium salpingitidis]|uniref:YccF family protein n=1 Tax=Gallibacterium salpingitidis TaxID=505341 RepID=UPI00266F79EB|nr:YccF domain-containing protein [Gallibacterium salpingitidis]WKS98535.1 YccF domain-containing protein [Gallibacterium salpingitidis]